LVGRDGDFILQYEHTLNTNNKNNDSNKPTLIQDCPAHVEKASCKLQSKLTMGSTVNSMP